MNKILVITATYNEADNIECLINSLYKERSDIDILVVDDNSPDGTAQKVKDLTKTFAGLNIIERAGKLGYGSAFVEGFKWGLAKDQYDYFVSMDADFSHNPCYLNSLLSLAESTDVVIGSRYIPGGGTKNWGLHRRLLSKYANIYARIILNISIKDCTGGFRCYRKKVLEEIDFDSIISDGYSFVEELLYLCKIQGSEFGEVPIIFEDRQYGKSKINKKEIFKAIVKVPYLRFFIYKK